MRILSFLFLLLSITSCNQSKEPLSAQDIIDKAIERAGGSRYEKSEIEFGFRENTYTSSRDNGIFELTRTISDSLGKAKDILNNNGLKRFREGEEVPLHDTLKTKYANSVNSVHYFLQLPFGLNAPAVKKQLVGEDSIMGKPYYEIRVTFREEGGGEDHEDEYLYWIHKEDFTVDYLAYRFYVEEGGIRFRKAYNPRFIEGLRFVDYENYKLEKNWENVDLKQLDDLFEEGKLPHVSTIATEIESVEIKE